MSILTKIADAKKDEVAKLKRERLLSSIKEGARSQHPPLDFQAAIRREGRLSLIAELKKASPSRGVLRKDFDVHSLAQDYARGGAQALSVLTDREFFQGNLSYLPRAKEAAGLPVLRKDFIIDEWQVWQSREAGADAVLLIAALLTLGRLRDLKELTIGLGMAALVEVHNMRELDAAGAAECRLIGINNRDLHSFKTDLKTTLHLLPKCPKDATLVSESGVHKRGDAVKLKTAGVHALLVGESLIASHNIPAAVKEIMPEGDV
jgi:indole-3-glycerol phosphate synthase